MEESINCVFCEKSDENLTFFTEETLRKCKKILKQRKIHNLKYKNVVLPVDLFANGYHKQCYKSFTGLMKKYYLPKSTNIQTSTSDENAPNITEDISTATASTSTSTLESEPQRSSPASICIPEPIILPEPTASTSTASMSVEPVLSNIEKQNVQLECVDFPSASNISFESDVSVDENKDACIFCNQKTKKNRSKRLPLHSSDKKDFLLKIDEKDYELIDKVKNYVSQILYHRNCLLDHSYKVSTEKKTNESDWHNVRQQHQAAFNDLCDFIKENVIEKGRYYFLGYLHRYYMELLKEKDENSEEIIKNFTAQSLENKIMKVFNKEVKFLIVQNKKLLVQKQLTMIDDESLENLKDEDILHKAALLLRKSILQAEKKKLPNNITVRELQKGEVSVPQDLLEFYFTLIAGSNRKRKKNRNVFVR